MAAHAFFGASKAHRWMACPASAKAESLCPNNTSAYAAEGTAAHEVASSCHKYRKVDRDQWLHKRVNGVKVTAEMLDAVDVFLEWTHNEMEAGDLVWIEHKFSLENFPDFPEMLKGQMFGTADFVRFRPSTNALLVADYKHGAGIVVDVGDNAQLKYYALGCLLSLPENYFVREVTVAIIQPRARGESIKTESFLAVALLDWGQDLIDAAVMALQDNADLVPGEHCQFCNAAAMCPALRNRAMAATKDVAFEVIPPTPSTLTKEEVGALLLKADEIEAKIKAWAKPFREWAFNALSNGEEIPGWKLVEKRADRVWKPAFEHALIDALGADAYKPEEYISVAQAEKLIGKKDFANSEVAKFVTRESSGYNMVPESDKRSGVKGSSAVAAIQFSAIGTEETE